MKPIIVGEQPSKTGDPSKPIEGRIGRRLAECCGLSFDEYLRTFDRVNLLPKRIEYGPERGNGDAFNVRLAKGAARSLVGSWSSGRVFLILGKRAASAFGLVEVEYFDACPLGSGIKAFVVPHPSGINRWWNDPAHEVEMCAFMRRFVLNYVTRMK